MDFDIIPRHIFETQITRWLNLKDGMMLSCALGRDDVARYVKRNAEEIWHATREHQSDFIVGDVYIDQRNNDCYAVAPVTLDGPNVVFMPIEGPAGLRPRRISKKWCRGWDVVTFWGDTDACVLKRLEYKELCDTPTWR